MSKEKRFILRLDARRKARIVENRKTKAEILELEGKRYYNFALPFGIVDQFFQHLTSIGVRPNDWILEKIKDGLNEIHD